MKRHIKKGFTLAEVLITLGIIGIAAALTMPALVGKYKDKVLLNQSKRTFSLISNAFNMLKAESGLSDYSGIFEKSHEEILNNLASQIQVIENCGVKDGCWAKETKGQKKSDGNYSFFTSHAIAKAILNDGSTIGIMSYNNKNVGTDCLTRFTTGTDENGNPIYQNSNQCGLIFFDTNGKKGPNQYGADTFSFIVKPDKIVQYEGKFYDALTGNTLDYEK